jgi:hypothetical protein
VGSNTTLPGSMATGFVSQKLPDQKYCPLYQHSITIMTHNRQHKTVTVMVKNVPICLFFYQISPRIICPAFQAKEHNFDATYFPYGNLLPLMIWQFPVLAL